MGFQLVKGFDPNYLGPPRCDPACLERHKFTAEALANKGEQILLLKCSDIFNSMIGILPDISPLKFGNRKYKNQQC